MLQDVLLSRHFPRDLNILRAELCEHHRVWERIFLQDFLSPNSVGAELGVFTGLFSAVLSRQRKISQVTFIDPWWKAFGDRYPDWNVYTDHGRIKTRAAYEAARRRIFQSRLPRRIIEVGSSYDSLQSQPDESIDWVYLDSTHTYGGTKLELNILNRKLRDNGMILGDDWRMTRDHRHHGVFLAVNEFLKTSDFEVMLCGKRNQWILRRSLKDKTNLRILWRDSLIEDTKNVIEQRQ
jgi:Methyltransferase domain